MLADGRNNTIESLSDPAPGATKLDVSPLCYSLSMNHAHHANSKGSTSVHNPGQQSEHVVAIPPLATSATSTKAHHHSLLPLNLAGLSSPAAANHLSHGMTMGPAMSSLHRTLQLDSNRLSNLGASGSGDHDLHSEHWQAALFAPGMSHHIFRCLSKKANYLL